jgi:hypothetical protein
MNAKMNTLQKAAIKKLKFLDQKRSDPRFTKTIGKLIHAKLISNSLYKPYNGKLTLDDALWSGQYEPRILELIPAIVLKKPKFFEIKDMPKDLMQTIRNIKHGMAVDEFRGVPSEKYLYWLDKVGHKGKQTSLIKTYRFFTEDVKLINELKQKMNISEAEIIRTALSELYSARKGA